MATGPGRVFVIYEGADDAQARPFIGRLAAAFPESTVDAFVPSFAFSGVQPWLLEEARGRIREAELVLCLVGRSSASSPWATWTINGALEAGKRVVCARVRRMLRDEVPPIATQRGVPVLDADVDVLAAYLEHGEIREARREEPALPLGSRLAQRR